MKTIRHLAGILLLVSGALHFVAYFQAPRNPESNPMLAFGIIYMIIGALLFNRKKYPLYLAVIVPLIGMTLSLIKLGIPELISLSTLFKVMEIIAVVCCLIILFNKQKTI
jgi:uncharacterized membrane protein HdeD (DUF308 family)